MAFASKPVIDRDHEVISWNAWDLANYKKNPIVMWAHDYREKPVGRSMWVRATQEGLKFKPAFADTEQGNEIYQLYKDSVLHAFSVGFIPKKWHDPGEDDEETRDMSAAEKAKRRLPRRIYDIVELLEISCVPVPACPDALVEAFKEGKIKTKVISDYIQDQIADDVDRSVGIQKQPATLQLGTHPLGVLLVAEDEPVGGPVADHRDPVVVGDVDGIVAGLVPEDALGPFAVAFEEPVDLFADVPAERQGRVGVHHPAVLPARDSPAIHSALPWWRAARRGSGRAFSRVRCFGPVWALTAAPQQDPTWNPGTAGLDRQGLIECLERNYWSIPRAAKMLGIHRTTLWRKVKKHNISLLRK